MAQVNDATIYFQVAFKVAIISGILRRNLVSFKYQTLKNKVDGLSSCVLQKSVRKRSKTKLKNICPHFRITNLNLSKQGQLKSANLRGAIFIEADNIYQCSFLLPMPFIPASTT